MLGLGRLLLASCACYTNRKRLVRCVWQHRRPGVETASLTDMVYFFRESQSFDRCTATTTLCAMLLRVDVRYQFAGGWFVREYGLLADGCLVGSLSSFFYWVISSLVGRLRDWSVG